MKAFQRSLGKFARNQSQSNTYYSIDSGEIVKEGISLFHGLTNGATLNTKTPTSISKSVCPNNDRSWQVPTTCQHVGIYITRFFL